MSDLSFSSTEVYQFSNRSGAIEIPEISDQGGGSLTGGITGSAVAAAVHDNLLVSAQYYMDRATRGLAAYQQLTAEIAQKFEGQDRVNADRMQEAWSAEYEPLRGNNRADAPPKTSPSGLTGNPILDVLYPLGR